MTPAPQTAPSLRDKTSMQWRAVQTRDKLLDAALKVIRAKGYSATTVDDICAAAGVTKGSYFHHFKGKEDLAIEATKHWNETTGSFFANAPYQQVQDPRERLLAYIDLRTQMVQGDLSDVTCLLGTLVQETFDSHPAIRAACREGIERHARTLVPMIEQAKALYAPHANWQANDLALYTQAALQGAFVVAKAQGSSGIAPAFIAHLRQYVQGLLTPTPAQLNSLDTYIDGYITVVPHTHQAEFVQHVKQCAPIYQEYGALRVFDAWADDLPGADRINSFGHAMQLSDGENIVFSWIEWPTRAMRNAAWPLIVRDPRMSPAFSTAPFDSKRMLRGGFQAMVNDCTPIF